MGVGQLVELSEKTNKRLERLLCFPHHSERVTGQHGGPFLVGFAGEQELQRFNRIDAEFLHVADNNRIVENVIR